MVKPFFFKFKKSYIIMKCQKNNDAETDNNGVPKTGIVDNYSILTLIGLIGLFITIRKYKLN